MDTDIIILSDSVIRDVLLKTTFLGSLAIFGILFIESLFKKKIPKSIFYISIAATILLTSTLLLAVTLIHVQDSLIQTG